MSIDLKLDYYKILGVNKKSALDDIKKAFMSKALQWHPDKAPLGETEKETQKHKEQYQKKYLELQHAYKILTNPSYRKQYDDALQKTFVDLRNDKEREVGYKKSKKYTRINDEGKRVFDHEKFAKDFNKKRKADDADAFSKLQENYNKEDRLTGSTIEQLDEQRNADLKKIGTVNHNFGKGKDFDRDAFNRMFDHQKMQNPSSVALAPYEEPQSLFSGQTAVTELNAVFLNNNGFEFGGMADYSNLVQGAGFNPDQSFSVDQFRSSDHYVAGSSMIKEDGDLNYTKVTADSTKSMLQRIKEIEDDRKRLSNLSADQYKIVKTEVEMQYNELFEPHGNDLEGLEKKNDKQR